MIQNLLSRCTTERETWELLADLVEDMSVFNTFLYGNDFHNLKAAQVYKDTKLEHIPSNNIIDPDLIRKQQSVIFPYFLNT